MASYKLNIARMRGCPDPQQVVAAMQEYGLPRDEEFGVLHQTVAGESVTAAIVRRTRQVVQSLDVENREVTATAVDKAVVFPFSVYPKRELLEIYAGSATAIEQVGVFFSGTLTFPTVTEAIELDLPQVLEKLAELTNKFQLVSVRITDYAHSSYVMGAYAPKFTDTQHGTDFMEKYQAAMASAKVRFQLQHGRANVTLTPKACFSFSCDEEDRAEVQMLLRKLV